MDMLDLAPASEAHGLFEDESLRVAHVVHLVECVVDKEVVLFVLVILVGLTVRRALPLHIELSRGSLATSDVPFWLGLLEGV